MAIDSKTLVADVLGTMKAAGTDPAADAALAAAAKSGRTFTAVTPAPVPAPAPPAVEITMTDPYVVRPNGEKYYVRRMGAHSDVAALREARRLNLPPLYYGLPGNGKTALFEAAFAEDGFEMVPGDGDTSVADFVGGYVPEPDGSFLWVDGPLPIAMEAGLPLLIDEIALIDPKVLAVVYSVMDGRSKLRITSNPRRAEVVSQPGFFVVGACNPSAPGARMSEALLSRFLLHIEMKTDFQLMRKMGVSTKLVTIAQNLEKKYQDSQCGWFPGIRELLGYQKIVSAFGEETALSNIISQAPEMDRPIVADAITRGFARPVKGLEIK